MREKRTLERVQHRRSRTEAEQLVEAFESSGLGRREFCLKHGVALGTVDFWRKRRRQERDKVASKRARMRNEDVRAGVASGSKLVAVELAGLQENAAGGGLEGRGGLMRRRWSVCWLCWSRCDPCLD